MMPKRRFLQVLAGAGLALNTFDAAAAQFYPQRPVRIVVSGVPGAAFDLVARALADKLSASLNQTFVVENRAGAAGNLGAELVARAAPDGYTLLVALDSTFTINPNIYKSLRFDPAKDLRPIAILVMSSTMLVVHPSVPAKSVPELVDLAKRQPMSYAHGGNGSPGHLSMEYFRLLAGFPATPVPYRGSANLITDLVAGHIKLGFVSTAGVIQHVRAGRLNALAISASRRAALAPQVPTLAEAGYPNFKVELHHVLLAPSAVPDSITTLVEREVLRALQSPDFQKRFRDSDIEIVAIPGTEAEARIKADRELWAGVVKAAGMQVD